MSLSRETLAFLSPVAGGTSAVGTTCDITCNTTLCTVAGIDTGCGSGQPCVPTQGVRCVR